MYQVSCGPGLIWRR